MEYKKEAIEFLEEQLKKTIQAAALTEAEYRNFTSQSMKYPKDSTISGRQTETVKMKEALALKIRYLRDVIKEIKDGKLVL